MIFGANAYRMAILLVGASALPSLAQAPADPYGITPLEKAACTPDAERLCANSYSDEQKLLVCMQANKAALTPRCLVVFNAGVKRRHLGAR